jgi:hypothetical protein
MDAAMRLIHLNGLMRQAVKLIRGVQLCIEEDRFRFSVFSAISWFKVRGRRSCAVPGVCDAGVSHLASGASWSLPV